MAVLRRQAANSSLTAKRWTLPRVGTVRLIRPARARLEAVDAEWGPMRAKDDLAVGWVWASVANDPDVFAVIDGQDAVLAVWRASKPVIEFGEVGRFYRLDNIEVYPQLRGALMGRFAVLLVAARAIELGVAIVLAAPESRVPWYLDQGAVRADDLGWKCPKLLYPLKFAEDAVRKLKEKADALEEK